MSRKKAPGIRIVSGGQSGVDRAALDAAMELGLQCGGWCPKGRRAEDGLIDDCYPLTETPGRNYSQRTEWNVRDSEATLILTRGKKLSGGTAMTRQLAQRMGRPLLVVDPAEGGIENVRQWLGDHGVTTLNVAGPRQSQQPGIYESSKGFLRRLIADLL